MLACLRGNVGVVTLLVGVDEVRAGLNRITNKNRESALLCAVNGCVSLKRAGLRDGHAILRLLLDAKYDTLFFVL
jgi:hypothetical protein